MKVIRYIIAIVIWFVSMTAQADNNAFSWVEKGVWPESPRAATIREVTSPKPAMLTGAAEFSVPLYTLDAEGLQIPFVYRYHSNGIKIEDDPCPWGYGWSLMPSIRISRRIVGRPDLSFARLKSSAEKLSNAECFYSMTDSLLDQSPGYHPKLLDPAPDIFTVQLADKQFNFVIDDNGHFITAGNDEYKIETSQSQGLFGFVVTDPAGFKYVFDTPGEYSLTELYCTEWLPSKIICPSLRQVQFSYVNCQSNVQNQPQLIPRTYYFFRGEPWIHHSDTITFTHPSFGGTKHLSMVTFAGEKIEITYSGNQEGKRHINTFVVLNSNNRKIRQYSFSFDSAGVFPTQIVTPEGNYTFGYQPKTFHEGSGRDWWGFYNGTPSYNMPGLSIDPQIFGHNSGILWNSVQYGRNSNSEAMQEGMLTSAIYPTGAQVEWSYEMHRFDQPAPINAGAPQIGGVGAITSGGGLRVTQIKLSNGANDPTPQIYTYHYGENNNNKAVCTAAPTPDTFISNYDLVEYCEDSGNQFFRSTCFFTVSYSSSYMQYRFGETPIWYSRVEEIAPEGKTIYTFTTFTDSLKNTFKTADSFISWPTSIYQALSSGPQPDSTIIYASEGNAYRKVREEVNLYKLIGENSVVGHHIARSRHCSDQAANNAYPDFTASDKLPFYYPRSVNKTYQDTELQGVPGYPQNFLAIPGSNFAYFNDKFTIYCKNTRLIGRTVTEYREGKPYTVQESYTYKNHTGLLSKTVNKIGSDSITQSFRYPDDGSPTAVETAMLDRNMRGIVIGDTINSGSKIIRRADMRPFGTTFRPYQIFTKRANKEFGGPCYQWNGNGYLISEIDSAGINTTYDRDSTWGYPLKKQIANLVSRAEWLEGVGVSSLTMPDGVKATYSYDSCGRLQSSGIANIGTLKYWIYNISSTSTSTITEYTLQNPVTLSGPPVGEPYVTTSYDALGRVSTVIKTDPGLHGRRYGRAMTYDTMGRPYRTYPDAPVSANASVANIIDAAEGFYNDDVPYSQTFYEASQRGLATASVKAGALWHNGNHRSSKRVLTNDSGNYSCVRLQASTGIEVYGNWPDGSLSVTETIDEDGLSVVEFTDFRGNCVMRRHDGRCTYFVYDDFGQLRYILPPDINPTPSGLTSAVINESAYVYRYDNRGRNTYSKIPGCGPSKFIYDGADRLVAETNADLGALWRLHFYDNAGREVMTVESPLTSAQQKSIAQCRTAQRQGRDQYSINFELPPTAKVCTRTFYDDYSFLSDSIEYPHMSSPQGHITGIIGAADNGYQCTDIFWYDQYGRQSGSYSDRPKMSTINRKHIAANGNLLRSTDKVQIKTQSPWEEHTLTQSYAYDGSGRLIADTIRLDNSEPLVRKYTYDAIGRLKQNTAGLNGVDKITREYSSDIHGWITEIKTTIGEIFNLNPGALPSTFYPVVSGGSAIGGLSTSDLPKTYTETIMYNTGTYPRWNGTPSARSLTNGGRYDYKYDSCERLTEAIYTAPQWNTNADFSTRYTYDILSRPTSLKRWGVVDLDGTTETFGVLDDITYAYIGALPGNIFSNTNAVEGREFYGRTGFARGTYMTQATRTFNDAGRLVSFTGEFLSTTQYNTQGLPVLMSMASGNAATTAPRTEMCYDYNGNLISISEYASTMGGVSLVDERHTLGAFNLRGDSLDRVDFGGGYYNSTGAHLNFTDWQGNVTITASANGQLEQHVGYYPYGEPWREPGVQRHSLHGGKERLSGTASGTYRYPPRLHRASLAQWDSFDKKAPNSSDISPWTFCNGNPIANIDPSGNDTLNVSRNSEGVWLINSINIAKGNDIIIVDDGEATETFTYDEGSYGKRIIQLNLEIGDTTNDETLGVYHISGVEEGGTGFYVTPGGASSNRDGSKARINDGLYPIITPKDDINYNWHTPGIGGSVAKRGIRYHYGKDQIIKWTFGCFIVFTDYTISQGRIRVDQTNSIDASRRFNEALGGETKSFMHNGKERQGASFKTDIPHYLILKSR